MEANNLDLLTLFKQFENDIVYDCHSLRAKVSRSRSGKLIILLGPKVLAELAIYLKNRQPPSKIKNLSNEVNHAWGILLSWMCEEHSLNRENIAQTDFQSWVKWTTTSAFATA